MCTIGYFEHEGTTYAGKNREPGKDSLDTLVVSSRHLTRPKLLYVGVDPERPVSLDEEIVRAVEDGRCADLERELGIELHYLNPGEGIPEKLKGKLSDNLWGGIYPSHKIGMPAASPAKSVFLIPTKGQTVVGNYSHYNLGRCWGGVNEQGVFVQSSSIRHQDRLKGRPSYSVITDEALKRSESAAEALAYVEQSLRGLAGSQVPGGANLLVADGQTQAILEFVPGDVAGTGEHQIRITSGEEKDFRSNFGLETRFFEADDWTPDNSTPEDLEHFRRSVNRVLAAYTESGPQVFSSHTVFEDLFDPEMLREVFDIMREGDLREIGLSSPRQFSSFYSICTHPVMEDPKQQTYKRTFWSMMADLNRNRVSITYDNPCQTGAEIEVDPEKIAKTLEGLSIK